MYIANIDLTSIVIIIFYILAAYTSIRILLERRAPTSALAWIMFIMFVPFLGLLLYYLLGQNRIRKYVKRKRLRTELLSFSTPTQEVGNAQSGDFELLGDDKDTMRKFAQVFLQYGSIFVPNLNELTIYHEGEEAFRAIFAQINRAKNYVFVQYYILRSDRLGVELKKLLIEKSQEGVPVYILIDDMGSWWLSRKYIKDLKAAKVKIVRFLPISSRIFQINFRNHRKTVIVDGECAFTGGLNVGDEYVGKRGSKKKYWRDSHIKIVGPAVKQLEEVFLEDWAFASRKGAMFEPSNIIDKTKNPTQYVFKNNAMKAWVQVIPTGPTDEDLIGVFLFMQIISAAKKRLWISTPYFVPEVTFMRQIYLAKMQGVDVRLLIPKESDQPLVNKVTLYYARQLAENDIPVYRYKQGILHQKLVIIDDVLTVVGTNNFDNRAIYLNFETSLVVYGKEFNKRASDIFNADLELSERLSMTDLKMISKWEHFQASVVRLLAPMM